MNKKCLFNHLFLHSDEMNKEKFTNEKENISIYTCKYCGKVLSRNIDSINALPKKIEKEDDFKFVYIYDYEGWSLNNMTNHLFFKPIDDYGTIYFISDKTISQLELYGLVNLVKEKFGYYTKKNNFKINITKGRYVENGDSIIATCNDEYIYSPNNMSNHFKSARVLPIQNAKDIIVIKYTKTPNERFLNKPKINLIIDKYFYNEFGETY